MQALLQLRPHTGRSHQLRVQLAGRGLPNPGDRKYRAATLLEAEDGRRRIARCRGVSSSFTHPTREEVISIVASVPADWPESTPGWWERPCGSSSPGGKMSPVITTAANGCQAVVSKGAGGVAERAGDDAGTSSPRKLSVCFVERPSIAIRSLLDLRLGGRT